MAIYPETNRTMLERVVYGDEVSWREFYDTYAPVVRAICRLSRVPEEKTDDIIQETMLRFSDRTSRFVYNPEKAHFRTYFNKIVQGLIVDYFRSVDREKNALPENFSDAEDFQKREMEIWRDAVLKQALAELAKRISNKTYLAFTMSSLDGKTVADTAKFLRMSANQVYVARNRCMAMLKEIVRQCNEADPDLKMEIEDL